MKYLTAFLSQFSNSQECILLGADRTDNPTCSVNDGTPTPAPEQASGAKVLHLVLAAPKAGALLAHCTRVRSDTSVTPADVEALAAHFEALGREAAIASERRLWVWWKTEAVPSVGAFLASEPKQKQPMPSRDGKGNAA